jgi:DNA repair and recombination protein RAD54B
VAGLSNEHLNGSLIFMIAGRECEVQSEISNSSNSNENIPLQKTTERLSNGNDAVSYYRIMYRKPQSKMHKSFDGDGYLSINSQDKCWILLSEKGEELGRSTNVSGVIPNSGSEFKLGGKEVELVSNVVVPYETYLKEISHCLNRKTIIPKLQSSTHQKPFKSLKSGTLPPLQPKFDPTKENALIMPTGDQDIVQVVVDPYISVKLKQFQRKGVQFLYQCLMKHKSSIYSGCVLADEMVRL